MSQSNVANSQMALANGNISSITVVRDDDGNVFEKRDLLSPTLQMIAEGGWDCTYKATAQSSAPVASSSRSSKSTHKSKAPNPRSWDNAKYAALLGSFAQHLYQAGGVDAPMDAQAFMDSVASSVSSAEVTRSARAVGIQLKKLADKHVSADSMMSELGLDADTANYLAQSDGTQTLFGYFIQRMNAEVPQLLK